MPRLELVTHSQVVARGLILSCKDRKAAVVIQPQPPPLQQQQQAVVAELKSIYCLPTGVLDTRKPSLVADSAAEMRELCSHALYGCFSQ